MEKILEMIISAFVGALAIWVVAEFIIPQIRGVLSNSPKLHGSWNYKDSERGKIVGTAKVTQFGNKVTVVATRTIDREGNPTNREFTYKGVITDRTLVLQYTQKGSGNAVGGSLVLRIDSDLRAMKGMTCYFSDYAGAVVSHQIFYYATV